MLGQQIPEVIGIRQIGDVEVVQLGQVLLLEFCSRLVGEKEELGSGIGGFQEGAKNLAEDLDIPFLGEIPLVQGIREAGDVGRPAAMQTATPTEEAFEEVTKKVVEETVRRNETLPPTEAIKITTMAGCSAVKK